MISEKSKFKTISILKVLRHLKISVSDTGFIQCPFHIDDSPSLKVYGAEKGWYCFGCCKGGGGVEFLSYYLGVSRRQVLEKLCKGHNWIRLESSKQPSLGVEAFIDAWDRTLSRQILAIIPPSDYGQYLYDLWIADWNLIDLSEQHCRRTKNTRLLKVISDFLLTKYETLVRITIPTMP